MIVPSRIQPGDLVGVVSPSGAFERERLQPGLTYLEQQGYRVRVGSAVYERARYLAGEDSDRAADLNTMFADPEVRAIFAARGGYGSARVLDLLGYERIQSDPKVLVGFSDTTALQLGIFARTGLVSFSGVTLCGDVTEAGMPGATEASLWAAVTAGRFAEMRGIEALQGERAEGFLMGGCLSLVASLAGTGYLPDTTDALWFLEDVNEAPYRVDRMLNQLRMAGVFDLAAGVVFGYFEGCEPDREAEGTVQDVLDDFSRRVGCPVFSGLPYGHGPGRQVLPIGLRARVDGGTGLLRVVDSA